MQVEQFKHNPSGTQQGGLHYARHTVNTSVYSSEEWDRAQLLRLQISFGSYVWYQEWFSSTNQPF